YATVLVYSDEVAEGCWSNNPCQFNDRVQLPLGCTDKKGNRITQLSNACQNIYNNGRYFLGACWTNWLAFGLNWAVGFESYISKASAECAADPECRGNLTSILNVTTGGSDDVQGRFREALTELLNLALSEETDEELYTPDQYEETFGFSLCNATMDSPSWERQLGLAIELNNTNVPDTGFFVQFGNYTTVQGYNEFLREHPDVFLYVNTQILTAIKNATNIDLLQYDSSGKNLTDSSFMPWSVCFDNGSYGNCAQLFSDADSCENWAALLLLPNPKTMKNFFQALVITTWVVLGITALICFMVFNAFPDYNDVDSWEGSIKSMGRACCMGDMFSGSAAVGGSELTVSHEVAKSLNLLFGGIDMDPTDRLLGIYLVSERQHRRRQQDVLKALQAAGYAAGRRRSRAQLALESITTRMRRRASARSGSGSVQAGGQPNGQAVQQLPAPPGSGAAPPLAAAIGSSSTQADAGVALNGYAKGKLSSELEEGAEAPLAVPLDLPHVAAGAGADGAAAQPAAQPAAAMAQPPSQQQGQPLVHAVSGAPPSPYSLASGQLPPSPFASLDNGGLPASPYAAPLMAQAPRSPAAPGRQQAGRSQQRQAKLMLYQQSMVRLRSMPRGGSTPGAGAAAAAQAAAAQADSRQLRAAEEGAAGQGGAVAAGTLGVDSSAELQGAEPEQELVPAARSAGSSGGSAGQAQPPAGTDSWQGRDIRVTSRFCPLLTPSGCAGGSHLLHPPLSPQAAADIYAGKLEAVDADTLREAQRISPFAVASYGLQSVIWAKGKRPAMCLANANRLVRCLKKPFRLEARFRKRNFDAIVQMTGCQPSDLLYVSYTNVAGGVLPYLIMLHRPSKSVVLSVRGTVSMEDLITDLLSNPVDVSDWVPEWVVAEAARRKAAGTAGDASGASLKAHVGIRSSTDAILKDLRDKGLMRELLLSKLLRTATLAGRGSQSAIENFLRSIQQEQPQAAPPAQQPGMRRNGAGAGGSGPAAADGAWETAAAAAAAANGHLGEDETVLPSFKEQEAQLMEELGTMGGDTEVDLPLQRAQTIIRSKLQLQGWQFVVTGHSLGAAVATLLGMHLRQEFPEVKCWAFNPPGGLLSWELAQIAQSYCTSIVVGKDVISRLSFNTSKRVVDEMVVSLARCTRPKLLILLDMLLGRRKRGASAPPTFCSFADISPEALELVESYYRASGLHLGSADTTEMYPPGKLVFLRPFKGRAKGQTVWDAVWIEASTLMDEGILVTPTMMAHHRLYVLADAFESIFANEAATQAAAQQAQGSGDILEPFQIND
ncbi:hypothetical protein ABPG75_004686, partial [Micractinium tetrahymenae]